MKTLVVGLLLFFSTLFFTSDTSPRQFVLPVGTSDNFVGSAVVVAPGVLVSVYHVAKHIKVVRYNNHFVPVTVVYKDEKNDIAVLQAVGVECPCAPVLQSNPAQDEEVVKVGFALFPTLGVQNLTEGKYQGLSESPEGRHYFIFTANAGPGDSGGGVFVKRWGTYYLVGLTDAIAVYEGTFIPTLFSVFAYAIPIQIVPSALLLG